MFDKKFNSSSVLDVATVMSFLHHRGIDTDSQNLYSSTAYINKKGEVVVQVLGNDNDKETLRIFCKIVLSLNDGGFVTRMPRLVFLPWKSMTTVHITSYRMNTTLEDVESYLEEFTKK